MSRLRWAILGAGAVGCLWGTHLKRFAGVTPTLLLRRKGVDGQRIATPSPSWLFSHVDVKLETSEGDSWWSSLPAQYCDGQPGRDRFDVVLVTTKSYEAEQALSLARPMMAPGARVVLLTNGALAAHEALKRSHGDVSFLLGSTTHGSLRMAPLHVRHTGRGQTWFGSLASSSYFESLYHFEHSVDPPGAAPAQGNGHGRRPQEQQQPRSEQLEDAAVFASHLYTTDSPALGPPAVPSEWADVLGVLGASQLGAEWDPMMQRRLWIKLAVNCAINPSTALARVPNGTLQINAGLAVIHKVCEEVAAVMTSLGMPITSADLEREVFKVIPHLLSIYLSVLCVSCRSPRTRRKTTAPCCKTCRMGVAPRPT